jgi:hypothetical protein
MLESALHFWQGQNFSLLHNVQTGSGAHTGSYPGGKAVRIQYNVVSVLWEHLRISPDCPNLLDLLSDNAVNVFQHIGSCSVTK